MKKVMWLGLGIEGLMLIVILIFIALSQPIPGTIMIVFAIGLFTCVLSSFKMQKGEEKDDKKSGNVVKNRGAIGFFILLIILTVALSIITVHGI
jgi:hypothetical protein